MAFFNDFKEIFASAAQSVTSKTKGGVETARLAGESRSAANDLSAVYEQIGRTYVDSMGRDTPTLKELCDRALGLRERIEQLERQRMQLRNQNRCPSCGAAAGKDARFCSNCGRRMPEAAPEAEDASSLDDVRYCPECGAMLKDGERFCAVCGFDGAMQEPAIENTASEQPAEASVSNAKEPRSEMRISIPIYTRPSTDDDADEAPDDFEAD